MTEKYRCPFFVSSGGGQPLEVRRVCDEGFRRGWVYERSDEGLVPYDPKYGLKRRSGRRKKKGTSMRGLGANVIPKSARTGCYCVHVYTGPERGRRYCTRNLKLFRGLVKDVRRMRARYALMYGRGSDCSPHGRAYGLTGRRRRRKGRR